MRAATRFLRRYSVSLVALALASLWTLLFWPVNQRFSFAVFIAAVMVSIWYDGPRRGLVTTALATLLLALVHWFQTPVLTMESSLEYYLRLGMFVLVGVLACHLCKQCRRAVRAVDHVHDILSSSGVALIFTDAEGQVVNLNPLAQSLTGWSQADAFQTPLARVFRLVHAGTHEPAANLAADVLQKQTRHELAPDWMLVTADGRHIPVDGEAMPVRGADSHFAGITVTFRDASKRREAEKELRQREEQWRALAAALPGGVLMLDGLGRCVYANAAALALCGCGVEESRGEGWTRFLLPQDRDRVVSDWLAAVKAKQKYSGEFRLQTPRGSLRWLQLYASPVPSDAGEVIGHVATLEDVSDRKQTDESLRQVQEELAQRIEASTAAQKRADEALKQAQAEFARQLDERASRHQQAADDLGKTREDLTRQLREQTAARTQAEAELRAGRQEFERQLQARAIALREAEEALRRAQEQSQARLREAEAKHQQSEDGYRQALATLQAELAERTKELAARTASHGEAAADLRQQQEHLQRQLDERTMAHGQAEEALRLLRESFQKQLDERIAGHHHAVVALRQEREDLARQLEDRTAAHQEVEESLRLHRADFLKQLDERATAHRQVEEALRQQRDDFVRQIDGLSAGHQEAHAAVQADLAQHREAAHGLRQSREQLQALLDAMPALVALKDAEGRFVFVNQPFAAVLRRDVEDIVGKKAAELLPKDSAALDEASDRQVLQARVALEVEEVLPNGHEPHTYLTGKFPVRDAVGSVSLDITGRKRGEERLLREKELLQRSLEAGPKPLAPPAAAEPATNGYHAAIDAVDAVVVGGGAGSDWLSYN